MFPRIFFAYEKPQMAKHIGNILIVLTSSTLIVCILTFVVTMFYEDIFSVPSRWIRIIPLLSFMLMVNTINLTILRMEGKAFTYGAFEVSNTAINMGITILLLVYYNYGWYSRAIGITVAYILFFLIGLFYMHKKGYLTLNVNRVDIKSILSLSLPLIPHALGGIIISMSDRFFIERMVDLEAVGVYTVGYMFGMIVMLFTDAFVKAWNPWFFKSLHTPTWDNKKRIVKFTYLYILGVFFLAVFVTLSGEFLLPYFVGEEFLGARKYILWISFGYVFFGIYQIFFPYLVHLGKTSFLAKSTAVAAIINLILNYLFIKWYGTVGAAYATIIAYIVSGAMVFFYQKKHFPMPWRLDRKTPDKQITSQQK